MLGYIQVLVWLVTYSDSIQFYQSFKIHLATCIVGLETMFNNKDVPPSWKFLAA